MFFFLFVCFFFFFFVSFFLLTCLFSGRICPGFVSKWNSRRTILKMAHLRLLPWTPSSCQEMQLAVTGASSDYLWLTSDESIISLSPYGVIKAKRPGIATVMAVSTSEPQNFDEVTHTEIISKEATKKLFIINFKIVSRLLGYFLPPQARFIYLVLKFKVIEQGENMASSRASKPSKCDQSYRSFTLKTEKNKFVALDNGKKATFECHVKPPFIGTSKPWIELETGNIYCIFISNSNNMKPLKGASSALLLGRLSVSGTRKTMNITSEFNNVIITILENSDVQIHGREKESLSMSSRVDVGVPKTEVEMIVTLSAAGQKMIIRYEVDESQIPVKPYFVYLLMVPFLDFIVIIIMLKVLPLQRR
ncbi:unnamed protein product [Brassica oleracea var. botrytis]